MSNGYIGQVKIGNNDYLIGSTLFGTCETTDGINVKQVELWGNTPFNMADGITIHVKFTHKNTETDSTKLKMQFKSRNGSYTDAKPIVNYNGSPVWSAGSVISFTYDSSDYVMNTVGFDAGNIATTNINRPIKINGTEILSSSSTTPLDLISGNGINITNNEGAVTITNTMNSIDWNNVTNIPTLVTSVNGKSGSSITLTAGDLGLSAALRFVGTTTTDMSDGWTGTPVGISGYTSPQIGDVVIHGDEEYVCVKIENTTYTWELLGRDSSFALDTDAIKKSDFTNAYQLIYSSATNTPAFLEPNTSDTIKYLSMRGNGTNEGGVPTWSEINKTTLGLGNVTNHQQVHDVSWDSNNTAITRKKDNQTANVVTFSSGGNITLTADTNGLNISTSQFSGATSSTDGTAGYLSAPGAGNDTKFLQGSGNWKGLSIPDIASVTDGILTITNVALLVT